ncbi:MAG TPA: F0F1 ATP synthase subunit B' [Xanthobacteraceae bacterium]|nr:F0F1 ATP synthase subunit B' [Xanthobacteraceae bacterium]
MTTAHAQTTTPAPGSPPAETTVTGTQTAPAPFPPFQSEHFASQLFWLALAFIVLYVLMAKVALPRVGSILQARRERIEADFAEAQRFREQSEAAAAAYEKALADARNRAQGIAAETREKFVAEAEENRKALEARLNAQLAEAERTIGATKSAAMANVRDVAVESAAAIVEKLIGSAPPAPAVAQAVDRVLKG